MNTPVVTSARSMNRTVIVQHVDQSFPYVLLVGTAGAIIALGSIWLTALALA